MQLWKQIFNITSLPMHGEVPLINQLTGPVVLEYCVTGQRYLEFMQNELP
jgi:hypothetical protein